MGTTLIIWGEWLLKATLILIKYFASKLTLARGKWFFAKSQNHCYSYVFSILIKYFALVFLSVPDKTRCFRLTKSQFSSILIKYFVSKNGNQWEFFVAGSVCKTDDFISFFSVKIRPVDNTKICFHVYVKLYQYRNNKSIKYSSNRLRESSLADLFCRELR